MSDLLNQLNQSFANIIQIGQQSLVSLSNGHQGHRAGTIVHNDGYYIPIIKAFLKEKISRAAHILPVTATPEPIMRL